MGAPALEAEVLLTLLSELGAVLFELSGPAFTPVFHGGERQAWLGEPLGTPQPGWFDRALEGPDRKACLDALAATERDGQPRTVELRVSSGSRRELFVRLTVARGQGGRLCGAIQDLTDERQHEAQWREVESWLSALGEALPFDFWIVDLDGRCVLQNAKSMERIGSALGRRPGEMNLAKTEVAAWNRGVEHALRGEPTRFESYVEDVGRHLVYLTAPVWQADGVRGVLGVIIDVTELKESERRLRQSMEELQRAQEGLVRKRQLDALGEMAAVVSHEVRNPLGSIANIAALFKRGRVPARDVELVGILEDEVRRIDQLISALLDFVRPLTPQLRPGLLDEVVAEALRLALLEEGAGGRIEVGIDADPDLGEVEMDSRLLSMALGNLFRNSLQAMPEAGALKVVLRNERRAGARWTRLEIADTGPGVTPELRARLFEPFVTSRQTGSGLGLTFAKRVVDEHRGQIEVTSPPAGGTLCLVRFPCAKGAS